MAGKVITIELKLNALSDLLNVKNLDVFPTKYLDSDAADYLYSEANKIIKLKRDSYALKVFLPKKDIESDTGELVTTMVHDYFAYKAKLSSQDIKINFVRGRRSIVVVASFVAFCFALGYMLMKIITDEDLKLLVQGVFVIAMWVAVWNPVDTFLFAWWPMGRDKKIYDKLASMPIEVISKD